MARGVEGGGVERASRRVGPVGGDVVLAIGFGGEVGELVVSIVEAGMGVGFDTGLVSSFGIIGVEIEAIRVTGKDGGFSVQEVDPLTVFGGDAFFCFSG